MKHVVVTGARGEVGRWVTSRFVSEGWKVTGIDLSKPHEGFASRENIEFRAADLGEQGAAWELLDNAEPDAVVHLAAIPRNGIRSGAETFSTNVRITYNILEAAGRLGIRTVWTSSDSIYGAVQAKAPPQPMYLPINESYPMAPADPYGTSKLVGEKIAESVTRRHNISIVSIRPVKITLPGRYGWMKEFRNSFDPTTAERDGGYWSYVDARDVARAIERAAQKDITGHEPFLIAAEENYLNRPTAQIIERVFGDLPSQCAIADDESAYTTEKARTYLDWEPQHSWKTAMDEAITSPKFETDI